MNESKHSIRSSSAKIDKIVCRVELSKANNRELKIADQEYFRALKGHVSTRETGNSEDFPPEIYNRIDKAVRDRLKEGNFGYDHSQLLALQIENNEKTLELNENALSKLLIQKINQNKPDHKLTYQEWKRKKETEDRIKRNLKMKVLRDYYEETLMKEQSEEEKIVEGKKKVRDWIKRKMIEERRNQKMLKKEKMVQEGILKEKESKAQENYRNWLREKLIKENQDSILKRKMKRKQREYRQREKEREIELKLQSEQAFQEWLNRKSRGNSRYNTSRFSSSQKVYKKARKPLKQLSMKNEANQRSQPREQKYGHSRPPLPRAAVRVEEFNSFPNPHNHDIENYNNIDDSSMSFLSESYESI